MIARLVCALLGHRWVYRAGPVPVKCARCTAVPEWAR